MTLKDKEIIVFEFSGVLKDYQEPLSNELIEAINKLLQDRTVIVLSDKDKDTVFSSFVAHCSSDNLNNLVLATLSGSELWFKYENVIWKRLYSNKLSLREKSFIYNNFEKLYKTELLFYDYKYGEIAQDHGSQITFSLLGEKAPLADQISFDRGGWNRTKLVKELNKLMPQFSITVSDHMSINVTASRVNILNVISNFYNLFKSKNIKNIIDSQKVLYVNSSLQSNINDAIVGVDLVVVENVNDTVKLIERLCN